jgi:hypothetical protein
MATAHAVVEESRSFIRTSQLCLGEHQILLVTLWAGLVSTLLRAPCIFRRHHLDIGVELVSELRSSFGSCGHLHL